MHNEPDASSTDGLGWTVVASLARGSCATIVSRRAGTDGHLAWTLVAEGEATLRRTTMGRAIDRRVNAVGHRCAEDADEVDGGDGFACRLRETQGGWPRTET